MTSFRFLHTADVHLDSPLRGLSDYDEGAVETIRSATREAFEQLISFALGEQVAFVVIAGDLYDGDWRDINTGLFFSRQMGRLNEAAIPVYLLYGNHDAESQITKRLELPANVSVFGSRKPETFLIEDLGVAFHGQSFRDRDVTENLALKYPDPVAGKLNIGVLHTGLGGMGGHANYAPCDLQDLVNRGYDYWALGHVHQAQVLHENPHIVFPGNLQGRHIRETGPKGASLVTVQDNEIADVAQISLDVVRWGILTVDVSEARNLGDVHDASLKALEEAVDEQAGDQLFACRLILNGRSPIHNDLLAAQDNVLADVRSAAFGLGEGVAWVQKVIVETSPLADATALAAREDAIGDLHQMIGDAAVEGELADLLAEDIGELIRKLPAEARAEISDDLLQSALEEDYAAVIRAAKPYLTARLVAGED